MPAKKSEPQWKPLKLDGDIFTNSTANLEGLIGIEELRVYDNLEVVRGSRHKKKKVSSIIVKLKNNN